MRTLILIAIGLALAAAILRFAPVNQRTLAAGLFTLLWLIASALNLRTGLSHGYTLAQELPIHALLFGLPTLAIWLAWGWLRRAS